jgi:DNA-binding MarR family transcriptional regulator
VSPAPRLDPLRDFGFLLKDVTRLYTRNFERRAAALGLTLERCRVLSHLRRHEGLCQAKLAELSEADPMTLGRLLVRMEAEGLVERHDDPNDGRAHRLVLGDAAKPLLAQIDRLAGEARSDALSGLGTPGREALAAGLQHVRANLEALLRPDAGT